MSIALGDFFPDDKRNEFAESKLKIGSVIKADVKDTTPPKTKRFIIVGIDNANILLATVYINSEINPNIFNTRYLKDLQYNLEKKDREYLDHDSYVDCSNLKIKKVDEIIRILKNSPLAYLGELNDEDLNMVKEKIKNSRTISIKEKKDFNLF